MKRLIFLFFMLFLLVGCTNFIEEEVLCLSISSPFENQIQDVNEFRLDRIWLTATYNSYEKQIIANEGMLSKKDLNSLKEAGEHEISFNYMNQQVKANIILYDSNNIGDNKYFIIYYLGEGHLYYGNSLYNYDLQIDENLYFYNYVLSDDQTFFDDGKQVYTVYAKLCDTKTYKVRFIYNDIVVYEEYVKKGESAKPPKMKTYDGYVFSGFIGDYTNISCDTDIYLKYEKGYEVIFYNYDNSVLDRQIVSKGDDVVAPELESTNEYIFLGWSEDFSNITKSLEIYPIFRKNEGIVVTYYKDYISNDTKLKTVFYEKDEKITFNYEISNYYIYSYSIDLDQIKNSCDVIVTYNPVLYRYYFDDNNYIEQPFYYEEPIVDGMKWILSSENTYVLIANTNYDSIHLITNIHGDEIVEYDDFISNEIEMYYALKNNVYEIYKWYSDEDYKNEVLINNIIPNKLYGRLLNENEYIDEKLSFEKCDTNEYMVNIKDYTTYNYCVIPSMYREVAVRIINTNIFSCFEKVFIGKNIVGVYDNKRTKKPITEEFIVSKSNEKLYYDNGLYIKSEEGLIFAGISSSYSSNSLEINCDIINPYSIPFLQVDTLRLNATTIIDSFGDILFAENIIISNKVKKLINRTQTIYGKISFESTCNIEMFSMSLWINNYGDMLPKSVKFLDTFNFYPYKSIELKVPSDHNYFKFINDILVDTNNTAISTRYIDQNKIRSYVVDSSISQFYDGFLRKNVIDTITFNNDVNIATTQNGIKQLDNPADYFFEPTIFDNMKCNKMIMNGNHYFNINRESQFAIIRGYEDFKSTDKTLIIGNQLFALRGITGDYKIEEDIIVDRVFIDSDCTINNLYISENSILLNDTISFFDTNSSTSPIINVIYY